jgi:RHS repeat-associated protein
MQRCENYCRHFATSIKYLYDTAGHLIAETSDAGSTYTEYFWLNDTPVALMKAGSTSLYYIHTDHLNTPRLIANQTPATVWRWDNDDPFGANMANENPSSLGTFPFNLRYPGQYFDRETNNHYNYYRDYSPDIGRYVESDPIGLRGGLNTYGYVRGNPVSYIDPTGEVGPLLICLGLATLFDTVMHVLDSYVQNQIENLIVQQQNQNLGQCISPNASPISNACNAAQSGQLLPIAGAGSSVRAGSQLPGTLTGGHLPATRP